MRISSHRIVLFGFLLLFSLAAAPVHAQTDSFTKNFKKFPEVAPGVDFFAAQHADVAPFEKPIKDGRQKLASMLGDSLAKGAIVICSTLAQKDSVNEARVLKMGYHWVLIQLTPAAANEQSMAQLKGQMEQLKASMGGQLPPGLMERLQNPSPEMKAAAEARMVSAIVQRFGYAVLTSTLAPDKPFRASRLDDVGRSPLADWLDIGLVTYAAGDSPVNTRFLQDRLEEAFPLEDLLDMPRPFVPPSAGGGNSSGGGPIIFQRSGGPAPGGAPPPPPPPGGAGVSGSASMPKDVQDRMTFDAQSALLFSYLVGKAGIGKMKELVQANRAGKSTREFLTRDDMLGPDLDKAEKEWKDWVKAQKVNMPGMQIYKSFAPTSPSAPGAQSDEGKVKREKP